MKFLYIYILLTVFGLFALPIEGIAQTHDVKARNCRYYIAPAKTSGTAGAQASDGRTCMICSEDEKKEMAVREAEDKRRAAAKADALAADKKAKEAKEKQEAETPKLAQGGSTKAAGVISIDLKGKAYTVTRDIPAEMKAHILGLYLCDTRTGSPVVELGEGVGRFQRHGVPADNIEFWADCDEQGVIRKLTGPTGNYQVTLLYKYTSGDRAGDYDLMGVTVVLNGFGLPVSNRPEITGPKYAVIYGERYKQIN